MKMSPGTVMIYLIIRLKYLQFVFFFGEGGPVNKF